MSPELKRYLSAAYRRDILRESSAVVVPQASEEFAKEVKAELARIDAMKLGASLANRDFVSYQNRRALVGLLEHWKSEG